MKKRFLLKLLAVSAFVASLGTISMAAEPVTIKIGASPVPAGDILNFVKPKLAEKGINLKIIEFSDYRILRLRAAQHGARRQGAGCQLLPAQAIYG